MLKMSCLEQFYRASLTEKTILLMAAFPILPYALRSVSIGLFLLAGLSQFKLRTIPYREWLRFFGAFTLGYFALTLSLGITSDMDSGFNELGQLAALVLIPLGFLLLKDKLTSDLIRLFKMIFVVSCFLLISYQVVQIIWHWETVFGAITEAEVIAFNLDLLVSVPDFLVDRVLGHRLREFTIAVTDTHPTYQALWLVISVLFIMKSWVNQPMKKWYLAFLICTACFWVYFIGSRMGQLGMALIIGSLLFTQIADLRIKLGIYILLIMGLLAMYQHPRFQEIAQGFNPSISADHIAHYNSSNVRLAVWHCTIETVKTNVWLGTGVGDLQAVLNLCYKTTFNAPVFTWTNYNTHNQYLHFWASAGLFGLLSLFFQCFLLGRYFFKNKRFVAISVLMVTLLFMMTENILVRSDGIHFFTTFMAIFFYAKR